MFKIFVVADFVYFWALFGANIRNIIHNINVQNKGAGGHSGPKYPFRRKSKSTFYFDVFRAFLNAKVGICIAMNLCFISKHVLKLV